MKILVCDDEPYVRKLFEVALGRQGHEVVTASDGLECLRQVDLEAPDAVVLDIVMPRLDGLEVLRRLREEHSAEDLTILIVTACSEDATLCAGHRLGANAVLTKPLAPHDVVRALAA